MLPKAPDTLPLSASVVSVARSRGDLYFGRFIYIAARCALAKRRRIAKSSEKTRVLRRAGPAAAAPKLGVSCLIGARFTPVSTHIDKRSRPAFRRAGRGFGPFLAARRFIISRGV